MAKDESKSIKSVTDISTAIYQAPAKLGECRLVLIDGPAGSGKTQLAAHVVAKTKAQLIHMDDMYQGWGNALTAEIMTKIMTQVLEPIGQSKTASYKKFDWINNAPGDLVEIAAPEVLIIEGVGAAAEQLRQYASLAIWIEVAAEIGYARVMKRDGDQISTQMQLWQQQERSWHQLDGTKSACDLWLDGNRTPELGSSEYLLLMK